MRSEANAVALRSLEEPLNPMIGPRGKVFRDPVHGLIRIEGGDEFIIDLINTPEFQRLRRVRQLGVSSFTYPGAEHTRFAHSLGVFNFAQRIVASLQRRYAGEKELTLVLDDQRRNVLAAALLHDVGHGPFSHMIERAFERSADHEKKTVALIQDGGAITDCLEAHKSIPRQWRILSEKHQNTGSWWILSAASSMPTGWIISCATP